MKMKGREKGSIEDLSGIWRFIDIGPIDLLRPDLRLVVDPGYGDSVYVIYSDLTGRWRSRWFVGL